MEPLLEVRQLKKYYLTGKGARLNIIKAVDNLSFTLFKGETFGLAGESGCGKSTLAKTLLRLMPVTAGEIFYEKVNLTRLSTAKMLPFRKKMQIVLQDPYESLNPQLTIGDALTETLKVHKLAAKNELNKETVRLLRNVGLTAGCAARYPHELSGGQRQRVVLARALALKPELLVFDEPFSSLDVSVQAQIINLLQDLQAQYSLTYLFISHDLSLVKHLSDRVVIMYLGKFVEATTKKELFTSPMHPYTKTLLASLPAYARQDKKRRFAPEGDISCHPSSSFRGCSFLPRCPKAAAICAFEPPCLEETAPGHFVACHQAKGR